MNEYVNYQDDLRCSGPNLVARRAKTSLRYYVAIAILAAASTLSGANLADLHVRVKRAAPEPRPAALTDTSTGSTTFNTDQGPGPGPIGSGPGCNLLPASASVGASVNLSYFGPPPSESNPSLVGPSSCSSRVRLTPQRARSRCRSTRDR